MGNRAIWLRYCDDYSLTPRPRGGAKWSKLTEDDLELIKVLKIEKPSLSLTEIISCVEEMGGENVSLSAVSRALVM